ncbi:YggS family pyridoxal phosphate-dependent enzyme [Kyrpidia tusciae]|uniref:Pyridoxal phosphate homeostasis protein n=1 Tax=Kyrpidia tusciae (strain DSM 2912 / NBRC 15312 / T2) TaxID=562970 RepID=D5WQD4_KYRT2|nr:YggS family pyridoxal phosphate-dependent enzyme [Kyrpidia tusciae]ADG06543.1 alanine racemase domain protein [Kyrpidia tusciae DSM 2912]
MSTGERIAEVKMRIARACARVGRDPSGVRLVAVSKYIDAARAKEWVQAGLTDLGENRLQVAQEKLEALGSGVTWHFIGHLQTNKVKAVIQHFAWLHSLDRPSLVDALARRFAEGPPEGPPLKVLAQVNVAGEEQKSGVAREEIGDFLDYIQSKNRFSRWIMAGFMTMAPAVNDPEEVRGVFRELRQLRDRFGHHPVWRNRDNLELSMGMSGDFEVAVEEGATIVRLGRILLDNERTGPEAESNGERGVV